MGERVDAERGLLDEPDAQDPAVDEAAEEVSPQQAAEERREHQAHGDDRLEVVAVLPDDDGVLVEIGNISAARALRVLLHHHPTQVRVQQALADRVGVLFGIRVAVVSTMVARPPPDRALDGAGADGGKVDLERRRGLVRRVCPETVVARRDAETRVEVVDGGENGRVQLQRHPVRRDEAH